jgi:hypothetical protein
MAGPNEQKEEKKREMHVGAVTINREAAWSVFMYVNILLI